jgi:hypothetical protein
LPKNRHVRQVFLPAVRTPVKTPYAAPNSVEERPPLISEGHTNFQFRPQNRLFAVLVKNTLIGFWPQLDVDQQVR